MKTFFTIPDNELFLESSIDPMGLRVIWTYYAHKIFDNKLTTIANDIRIYSINLFHHCIVAELFQDRAKINELSLKYRNTKPKKGIEREIKQGMIICLENVAILSFIESESDKGFDPSGIPGSYKAKAKLYNDDKIYLAIDKYEEILKNQVNLGMAGRYIGPMGEIGLFKKGLDYNDVEMKKLSDIFNSDQHYKILKEKLKDLLLHIFNSDSSTKRPEISFSDLKRKYKLWNTIRVEYSHCFGSRKVWKKLKEYFLNNLGLNKGAAGAIYDSIDIKKYTNGIPGEEFALIFNEARKICVDEIEAEKIDDILRIAPALSHTEYILRKMADPNTDSISEIEKDTEQIKQELEKIWPSIIHIKNQNFSKLKRELTKSLDTKEWALEIVKYHGDVMKYRGGQAWLIVNDNSDIKHLFSPLLYEEYHSAKKYIESGFWYHHYYLNTLLGFKKSLN